MQTHIKRHAFGGVLLGFPEGVARQAAGPIRSKAELEKVQSGLLAAVEEITLYLKRGPAPAREPPSSPKQP